MTINLIIATPVAGESAGCIDRILTVNKEQPLA